MPLEVRITALIIIVLGVLPAVDLNDQAMSEADEIDDVACDDHLAPELVADHALRPKQGPDAPFRIRGVGAHVFGALLKP